MTMQASTYLCCIPLYNFVFIYLASEEGTPRYLYTKPLVTNDPYNQLASSMDGLDDFFDAVLTHTY